MNGAIAYLNPAAEQLTQWKSEQAQGVTLAALFKLLDDNDQDDGLKLIERILSGQLGNNREHSRQIQRMDGSTVAVTLVGAPILHAGEVSGAVLVLHDMTQERQYIANLSWQATHDALTGLANRREFEYRLELVLKNLGRQQGRHALMFLDLDQFKLLMTPAVMRQVTSCYVTYVCCCEPDCAKATPWRDWEGMSSAFCWKTVRSTWRKK